MRSHCAGQRRAPTPAHTYNVDATAGSDTATGHEDAPLQTIAAVTALALKPGDRVLFKRGEVWSGTTLLMPAAGKPGRHITLGAYGVGAAPIIDGGDQSRTYDSNQLANYVTLRDIHWKGSTSNCLKIEATDMEIINCTIEGDVTHLSNGIQLDGTSRVVKRISVRGCTIFNNMVQSGGGGGFTSGGGAGASDVVVENCIVYSNGTDKSLDHGIYIGQGNNYLVRGCTIYSNAGNGIQTGGTPTNVLIDGNTIYSNGNTGIKLDNMPAAGNNTVRNNLVYNNNTGIKTGAACYQINIFHNTIVNNAITDYGYGIQLANGTLACVLKNNIVLADNSQIFETDYSYPIAVDHANVMTAAGNAFDCNLYMFVSRGSPRMGAVAGTGKTLAQWQAAGGTQDAHSQYIDPVFTTVTTSSTTVDADSAANQKVLNVTATGAFTAGQLVVINDGGARHEVAKIASITAGVSLTMVANLVNAHTAVQADTVVHRVYTDLHIQTTSPCKAAGDPAVGVLQDKDGVTRGAAVDIGAYEYVA
jgi:hypothetical protein